MEFEGRRDKATKAGGTELLMIWALLFVWLHPFFFLSLTKKKSKPCGTARTHRQQTWLQEQKRGLAGGPQPPSPVAHVEFPSRVDGESSQ